MDISHFQSNHTITSPNGKQPSTGIAEFLGPLPKAFIITGFINFLIGSAFGGIMAARTAWIPLLLPLHEEINPFGWLTMMIYGMTFAVLALFAGLKPRWRTMGWAQWTAAELGVVLIALAALTQVTWIHNWGIVLQAFAPFLFLFNILSGVMTSRKHPDEQGNPRREKPTQATLEQADPQSRFQALLRTPSGVENTDKIAQRGTDMALMVFITAELLYLYGSFFSVQPDSSTLLQAALGLIYYGWIAGTVLAVALHLYPRYAGFAALEAWQANLGQGLWLTGTLIVGLSAWLGVNWNTWGIRIIGLAIVWFALSYLLTMHKTFHTISDPTGVFWWAAWVVALVLGVFLGLGSNPYTPLTLHLLFLGWITSLVYGIGYTFFPVLLQRSLRFKWLPYLQTWGALAGFCLMAAAFSLNSNSSLVLLAVGGSLAALCAWLFLLQWLFGHRTSIPATRRLDEYTKEYQGKHKATLPQLRE